MFIIIRHVRSELAINITRKGNANLTSYTNNSTQWIYNTPPNDGLFLHHVTCTAVECGHQYCTTEVQTWTLESAKHECHMRIHASLQGCCKSFHPLSSWCDAACYACSLWQCEKNLPPHETIRDTCVTTPSRAFLVVGLRFGTMAILSYLAISVVALLILNAVKERMFRPSNLPPVYTEFPYVPWIGSIWQFATGPREFLQRAHAKCGDIFTINLFGWPMTFLMSSEGHAQFFSAKEEVYDIREAYKCTVVTFGPDVCYDCPVKKMGEQLGFFKTGLTQDKFINYVPVIQDEVAAYFDEQWGDAGEVSRFGNCCKILIFVSYCICQLYNKSDNIFHTHL